MKTRILSALLALLPAIRARADDINISRFLECVTHVEGATTKTIGRAGERSRFQMTKAVWEEHTFAGFECASSSQPEHLNLQYEIAYQHAETLLKRLERPSIYRLALAWNGGLGAANSGNLHASTISYATRVRNLYSEP